MPIDDRRVTLKDIAEKTGFTVNTVSQALRGSPKLREETKAAIRAAAKELGYVHNALAGSLRSGSSRTIAIIVGDTSNLRFSIQLHAFELAFRTLGYQVIVMNTDETAQYELDAVKNAVRSSVDGVLLCPCQKSRAAIDLLESCRTPYVLFGRCYDDLPAVIWDDERGGYVTLSKKELAQKKADTILASAMEMGAEELITACPLCMYNLDANSTEHKLPIHYFTELLAEALGVK